MCECDDTRTTLVGRCASASCGMPACSAALPPPHARHGHTGGRRTGPVVQKTTAARARARARYVNASLGIGAADLLCCYGRTNGRSKCMHATTAADGRHPCEVQHAAIATTRACSPAGCRPLYMRLDLWLAARHMQ